MKWIEFVKKVEEEVKISRPEMDINEMEIAYIVNINISYPNLDDMRISFSDDKLVVEDF